MTSPAQKLAPIAVTLRSDTTQFEAAITEFGALLSTAPECVFEKLVCLRESVEELVCLRNDSGSASAANEVRVLLEPADFFLRLLAAMRAGDWDRLSGKDGLDSIRHDCSSVGCVDSPNDGSAPGGLKDSSGKRARNPQAGRA